MTVTSPVGRERAMLVASMEGRLDELESMRAHGWFSCDPSSAYDACVKGAAQGMRMRVLEWVGASFSEFKPGLEGVEKTHRVALTWAIINDDADACEYLFRRIDLTAVDPTELIDDAAFEESLSVLNWMCGHDVFGTETVLYVCERAGDEYPQSVRDWVSKQCN